MNQLLLKLVDGLGNETDFSARPNLLAISRSLTTSVAFGIVTLDPALK